MAIYSILLKTILFGQQHKSHSLYFLNFICAIRVLFYFFYFCIDTFIIKPKHSVFIIKDGSKILRLIDYAWSRRGSPLPDDPYAYIINFKKPIGTEGETALKIIVRPGTSELITAFPIEVQNDS
jgi:hypothetical protein